MKLNPSQIQQLYSFTRKHFVEHYDLQTELVDHLANGIEALCQENPKLSFDEALNIEFKKFGVFGFSDVVDERLKVLSKFYWKAIWEVFKNFFKLPKILMTISMIVVAFYAIKYVLNSYVYFLIILAAFIGVYFYKLRQLHREKKARFKVTNKKWMYEDMVMNLGNLSAFVSIPLQTALHFFDKHIILTDLMIGGLAAFLVLFSVFSYIILFVVPETAKQHLVKTYPEYELI